MSLGQSVGRPSPCSDDLSQRSDRWRLSTLRVWTASLNSEEPDVVRTSAPTRSQQPTPNTAPARSRPSTLAIAISVFHRATQVCPPPCAPALLRKGLDMMSVPQEIGCRRSIQANQALLGRMPPYAAAPIGARPASSRSMLLRSAPSVQTGPFSVSSVVTTS